MRTFFRIMVLITFGLICFIAGIKVSRQEIARAIREGRLSLEQRVESVAEQIESGLYRPVGDP